MCMHTHRHVYVVVRRQLARVAFLLLLCGTEVIRLAGHYLYLMSHLTGHLTSILYTNVIEMLVKAFKHQIEF